MKKLLLFLATALGVALLGFTALQVRATPTDSSLNLIKNGYFDQGWVSYGDNLVGVYWTPYSIYGNPGYGSNGFEPGQEMTSGSAFVAGLYQTVDNTVPGFTYYCFVGTASSWNSSGDRGISGKIGRTIGVDPYGGTDPNSSNVIWGSEVWDNGHWNWKDDPEANAPKAWVMAKSTRMTLFLKAMFPSGDGLAKVWLDDAAIMLDTSYPTPTQTGTPTPSPTPTVTPTPTATPLPLLSTSAPALRFLAENPGDPVNSQTLMVAGSNGAGPLNWSVQVTGAWLSIGPTSGITVPRTLSIGADTTGLPMGQTTGTLTFHNASNPAQPDVKVDAYANIVDRIYRVYLPEMYH